MEFYIKPGFELNPNKKVVDAILKGIERCDGECPCANDSEDKRCPCSNLRIHNKCCCNLYVPCEIWSPINGFDGEYEISSFGRVKSLKSGIILRQYEDRGGYLEVHLRKHSKKYHKKIHRLVAEAFLPNPNNYLEVNHKDENKKNNRFDNLEWCTHQYNSTYNDKHIKHGIKMRKPVLQYDLRGNFIARYLSQTHASKITGISQGVISNCANQRQKQSHGFVFTFDTNDTPLYLGDEDKADL